MRDRILLILRRVLSSPYFIGGAFLFALHFFLFFESYTENKVFVSPDAISSINTKAPLREYHETTGEYPFWNPYIFSGMPAYESLSYNRFIYLPGEILARIKDALNLPKMFNFFVHVFMAGFFTFLFLKRRGVSQTASLFGGVIYMMNPYLITMIVYGHGSQAFSSAYIPLAFFAVSELWSKPTVGNLGFTAAAIGFQLQSRHIQIVYYTWMLIGFYLLYALVIELRNKENRKIIGKKIAYVVGALALAFTLAAVLYLPVHSYTDWSTRAAGAGGGVGFEYATQWSFSPGEMMTFLFPSFYGFGGATYWGSMPFTDYPNYMGILALFLAIYALVRNRSRLNVFLGIVIVLALLISFGRHFSIFYSLFYEFLPFFNKFRVPAMILILVQFSVSILAAYGLEALFSDTESIKKKDKRNPAEKYFLYGIAATIGTAVLVTLLQSPIKTAFLGIGRGFRGATPQQLAAINTQRFDLFFADFWIFVLLLLALLGIAYYRTKYGSKPVILGIAVLGLTMVDLGRVDRKITGGMGKKHASFLESSSRKSPLTKFFSDELEKGNRFRVFPVLNLFSSKDFAAQGIESIGGYHPAKLGAYQSFLNFTSLDKSFIQKYYKIDQNSGQTVLREPGELNARSTGRDLAFLAMLNVKYIVSPYPMNEPKFRLVKQYQQQESGFNLPVFLYEFSETLPRAWLVNRALVFESEEEVINNMRTGRISPFEEALVSFQPDPPLDSSAEGSVEINKHTLNEIELTVETSGNMMLVLSEIYYPAGWNAFLDDMPVEIKRVDNILRAVEIPAGEHRVRMKAQPPNFTLGLVLTSMGYLVLVGIISRKFVKGKRQ